MKNPRSYPSSHIASTLPCATVITSELSKWRAGQSVSSSLRRGDRQLLKSQHLALYQMGPWGRGMGWRKLEYPDVATFLCFEVPIPQGSWEITEFPEVQHAGS